MSKDRKKILILGAKGMLGSDLMHIFSGDDKYEVIGWDRDEIDITEEEQVSAKIKELKPVIVINSAAYTDVDGCEEEKEICNKVNGYSLEYISKACKKNNAILVHISTDYVFDGKKKEGYEEEDEVGPVSQYGISKKIGEKNILKFTDQYYIVRISWLFGKNGKNFVETMLNLAKESDELKVVNDQHGKPTYTVDLSKGIKDLIESDTPYGIYHLPNEEETTWYDFAKKIFEISNINIKVNPCTTDEFPRPAKRPEYSSLINTKLPKLRSWQEALKDYLNK